MEKEEKTGLEKEATVLCHNCSIWYQKTAKNCSISKKVIFPPNSIAAGIDFGFEKRLPLTTP